MSIDLTEVAALIADRDDDADPLAKGMGICQVTMASDGQERR